VVCAPPRPPGDGLARINTCRPSSVSKCCAVILLSTQTACQRNKNGTDVVGVGTVVDCVVCVTNDIGTLVRSSSTTTVFASQAT